MSENEIILPSEADVTFVRKLEKVFGYENSKEILRMIKAVLLRRLHSVITWSSWYLQKLDIAGIQLRVNWERSYTDVTYEIIIRVTLDDLDPILIKKNLKTLYKMMKLDRDQERVVRELEAIVKTYLSKSKTVDKDESNE